MWTSFQLLCCLQLRTLLLPSWTRPIRFEFQCEEGADELKFIHNIPTGLVNPEALAARHDFGFRCHLAVKGSGFPEYGCHGTGFFGCARHG
ncbi:hypothetical protein B0T14DRAFT_508345 [Immersiella caudata]|uniref:Secreted protein n=1 Tax=Immersiella caudata TaxID=314043 RepID=A0AA39XI72_9PEZI|nr:hypothetical protein B0T14DRAFT_508345 [Immersiella caudata]